MDEELLALARAPTLRATVEDLSARLGDTDAQALAAAALSRGEPRAAINLSLAGALRGAPPSAEFATRLLPWIENTPLAVSLLGTVSSGLANALIDLAGTTRNTPGRQGLILYLAATLLDPEGREPPGELLDREGREPLGELLDREGREPPGELLTRIRLTARCDLDDEGKRLTGLAALVVDDPNVTEVARDCVAAADTPDSRRGGRTVLEWFETPIGDALPTEPRADFYGGFTIQRATPRTGRNDPCPCGSGKKYKRCCLDRATDSGPAANQAEPWSDRVRQHRAMTDAQFFRLTPMEIARVPPEEIATRRLGRFVEMMGEFRYFDAALAGLAVLEQRDDLPEDVEPCELRVKVLTYALAEEDPVAIEQVVATFKSPDAVPAWQRVARAIAERAPDALDRIEEVAGLALRDESNDLLARLVGVLIFYRPAFGILLARGTIDPADPLDIEKTLREVEEARDKLLLPPHDPAWDVFDLLSERHVEAQLERAEAERNKALVAEAEELRRSVAAARAREGEARQALERRERELESALRDAEARAADPSPDDEGPTREDLDRARRRVKELTVTIAEGNHERRQLRREIARVSAELTAAEAEEPTSEDEDDEAEREYGEDYVPDRMVPRVPLFDREFRDGLKGVADHVARAALAMAGSLAASDPGAWSTVKRMKVGDGLLYRRIGRHRMMFRLVGEDEMELVKLIHRRDLESTLRKMV